MQRFGRMQLGGYRRRAFTLVELLIASAIMAILMIGMASSIRFVAEAADEGKNTASKMKDATGVLDLIMEDLGDALTFTERGPNAVACTVPDRNGDGTPESIRYAWSGIAGDSLTVEYNGAAAETIAEDVHAFSLAYLVKTATD